MRHLGPVDVGGGDSVRRLAGLSALCVSDASRAYAQWLDDAGAKAEAAQSTSEALVILGSGRLFHASVVDVSLPAGCGLELAEAIAQRQPLCKVFIVADQGSPHALRRARAIPGATLIPSGFSDAEFTFAILQGLKCTAPSLHWLVRQISRESKLSRQQERLLWLNLWGYPDQEIAGALGIQLHTVRDYQLALRRKTGVRSKAGYLRLLLEYQGGRAPLERVLAR